VRWRDPRAISYDKHDRPAQRGAALTGYALAALPCFIAGAHAGLERVLPDDAVFERTYWLAVHEDLAGYPRVRALMTAIEAHVMQDRALFRPSAAAAAARARPAATILRWIDPSPAEAQVARRSPDWPEQEVRRAGGLLA
jgi:hypothetical protein